jgi:hypothetical protein
VPTEPRSERRGTDTTNETVAHDFERNFRETAKLPFCPIFIGTLSEASGKPIKNWNTTSFNLNQDHFAPGAQRQTKKDTLLLACCYVWALPRIASTTSFSSWIAGTRVT